MEILWYASYNLVASLIVLVTASTYPLARAGNCSRVEECHGNVSSRYINPIFKHCHETSVFQRHGENGEKRKLRTSNMGYLSFDLDLSAAQGVPANVYSG